MNQGLPELLEARGKLNTGTEWLESMASSWMDNQLNQDELLFEYQLDSWPTYEDNSVKFNRLQLLPVESEG